MTEIGGLHTVPVPGEERQADTDLEVLDAATERGLRDPQRGGGSADAAVLRQRLSMSDGAYVDLHRPSRSKGV